MAFSIKAVLIFPVIENPPDLAYDCMKGSRILEGNKTKSHQTIKNKKTKAHQPPRQKSPKHPNHQPPPKSTLAVSGY